MIQLNITQERKNIFIIGAVLLLMGIGYRFFPFSSTTLDRGEEIALAQRKIQKFRARVAQMDELQKRVREARITLERSEKILLDGETEPLAAVDIQNILNQIFSTSGLQVTSTRVLKSETLAMESYTGIRVEITYTATIRNIQEIVYRIESYEKWLLIEDLHLNVASGKDPEKISAKMVVMGVMKRI